MDDKTSHDPAPCGCDVCADARTDLTHEIEDAIRREASRTRQGASAIPSETYIDAAVRVAVAREEPLRVALYDVRDKHQKSPFPASRGEMRGKHYCVGCTMSVDDMVLYVEYPCRTQQAIQKALSR